jgi:hypothetical protein
MSGTPRAAGAGVGRGRLWFGLLGGPVAWTAHLMLAYAIAEFGCVSPFGHRELLGLTAVTWGLLGVSAVTLAVAVAATRVARRARESAPEPGGPHADGPPTGYLAASGLYLSGFSAFVILVQSVPILYYLRDC